MKWLTNLHDPKDPYAKMYVSRLINQTEEEAWNQQVEWLRDKIIGKPQATEAYTTQELLDMGLVGVYSK